MADIKELIPEFFYLPEFLVNNNNFELGRYKSKLHHIWTGLFSDVTSPVSRARAMVYASAILTSVF